MTLGIPLLFTLGVAVMAVTFLAVWAIAVRIRNAGIVDIAWAAGFSVLALIYSLLGPGWAPRRALLRRGARRAGPMPGRLPAHTYSQSFSHA